MALRSAKETGGFVLRAQNIILGRCDTGDVTTLEGGGCAGSENIVML